MFNKFNTFIFTLMLLTLSACGGDSASSDDGNNLPPTSSTTFSFSVSDAPVETLIKVVICFSQVELKGDAGDVTFNLDPLPEQQDESCVGENTLAIDLKQFTGGDAFTLLNDTVIESGDYSQLRLIMQDGSYGVLEDETTTIAIKIPSNELKLDGFTAVIGADLDLTAEFDLQKSMTNPVGLDYYFLKPRGVRLVDNSESATISGRVNAGVPCLLGDPELDDIAGSVYLYQGGNLELSELADNGGSEEVAPYASTLVTYDGENYSYEVGFVAFDDYTLAFSCSSVDSPEEEDEIIFLQKHEQVVSEKNEVVNFIFPEE